MCISSNLDNHYVLLTFTFPFGWWKEIFGGSVTNLECTHIIYMDLSMRLEKDRIFPIIYSILYLEHSLVIYSHHLCLLCGNNKKLYLLWIRTDDSDLMTASCQCLHNDLKRNLMTYGGKWKDAENACTVARTQDH